jgi:hypothetical protein
MAFVKESAWGPVVSIAPVETLPLKVQLLNLLEEFMQKNDIRTTRTIAKVYTIDLVREFGNEIDAVPDEKIRENLVWLVKKCELILGLGGSREKAEGSPGGSTT